MVVLGVAVSLALAALVWFRPISRMLWLVALFGLTFALLDVRELLHQLDEQRSSLALLAGIVYP